MPQLPQQWNNSAAQASLAPVASSPEYYIPLWWYSGSTTGTAQNLTFLQKGSTSTSTLATSTPANLHTLNSAWPATTKFALEVSMSTPAATTIRVDLYDITASALVSGSAISLTNATAMQVVRSGQFTLTPGHTYGIRMNGGSSNVTMTDASLIVFPS